MQDLRPQAVTIGIPTWNRRPLMQRALQSALAQTYPDLDIVVSDDGSTDDTGPFLDSIADPRVLQIRKPANAGLVANYNSCLHAAKTEFFLLLNDDDSLVPTAIEKLIYAFLHPPGNTPSSSVGVAWCPFTNISPEGKPLWDVRGGPPLETTVQLMQGLFNGTRGPLCSGIMVRTADALAAGSYQPQFGALCDSALWGKASLRHPFAVCVDEPLMLYQVHGAAGSATSEGQVEFWQNAIRQEIADFVQIVRARGDERGAQTLLRAGNHSLANVTMTVLMRAVGKPGWVPLFAREFWRSRSFMLTPFVFKRALKDGWKLLRLT